MSSHELRILVHCERGELARNKEMEKNQ